MKKYLHLAEIYCMFSCLTEVAILGISIQVCMNIVNGFTTAGDYIWYLGILGQISVAMEQLVNDASSLYDNSLRIENIMKLDHAGFQSMRSGQLPIDNISSIEFENVFFRYIGEDEYVLKNVSFRIYDNSRVALVGLNGAGKSTVIKLILRLYDVSAAEVLKSCGGTDIIDMCDGNLERSMGRIFEKDGLKFSEGQQQKIAIARSLYQDKNVYILDEPSSSSDPESEKQIFDYIENRCADKIIIFSSHRLSTVYLADRILVFCRGSLVENGTFAELTGRDTLFKKLFHYQAERYQI